MAELLANRSLARHHENDGNSSTDASVAMVSGDGGPVSQHDLLAALGPVRSNYKQIILLTDSDRIAEFDVSHAPRVSVVLPGEEVEIPHWLSSMIDKGFEVEASILWPVASSRLIETLEVRTGKAVARLLATVHQLGQDSRQRRDAVSRLARRFSRTEIGLALGSGAARGFAHVGVLQVFEEEGLPIDYIAGCSIGSVVGGLYASGTDPNSIGKLMHGADRKLTRWTWPIASLWSNSGLTSLLKNNGGKVRFSELNVPFAAVACDVTTAEAVVIRRGTVWKAVRASVSVPIMFPATLLTRRWLTDGGLVNPIPNDAARGLGADIVIGVDLLSPAGRARQGAKKRIVSRAAAGRVPNLIDMIWRSMEIMQEEITLRSASFADVTVEPDLGQVRWKDFSLRGEDFIAEGVRAAREKMPEIRQRIGTWR
jgi:NTE family protein